MRKKLFIAGLILFLGLSVFLVIFFSMQTDREYVRVEILNATKTHGLGEKFALTLKAGECDVISVARVECDSFPRTAVVERLRKNKANARIVSSILKCKNVFIDIDSTLNVDATVIIGEDFEKYIKTK
ncbi:MAG: LytR C-terminal domain-containing protein [bacterium]|nr:LytR C-terminal domain-containing protein [bacterium]